METIKKLLPNGLTEIKIYYDNGNLYLHYFKDSKEKHQGEYKRFYENGNLEMSPAYDYGPLKGKTSKGEMNLPIVYHQVLELDGICGSILENKPNITPGEEGLKDMKLIEAIFKAAKTGKEIKV